MFCFPIVGIQIVIGNFFQATGKAAISIFLAVSRQLLFLVPFLLILPRYFQLNGIWASLPSADILSCSASVIALICFLRKLRNKPEPSTAEEA
jgi:Na+-driven multidrug efflux pump